MRRKYMLELLELTAASYHSLRSEFEIEEAKHEKLIVEIRKNWRDGSKGKAHELHCEERLLVVKVTEMKEQLDDLEEKYGRRIARFEQCIRTGLIEELQSREVDNFQLRPDWEAWLNDPDYIMSGPMTNYESYLALKERFQDPVDQGGPRSIPED